MTRWIQIRNQKTGRPIQVTASAGLTAGVSLSRMLPNMKDTLTVEFDGGSRGNPGPAAIGVVIRASDATPLLTLGRCIGRATNNAAEYQALITGLQEALKLGARRVLIRGDSELIVKQMRGEYRVKHPDLRRLYDEAQELIRQFEQARLEHNLRHRNALADKLANLAMDRKSDVTELDEDPPEKSSLPEPQAGDQLVCRRCGCVIQVIKPSPLRPHQLRPFTCQCGNKMDDAR
jgi:ribonuclease HI